MISNVLCSLLYFLGLGCLVKHGLDLIDMRGRKPSCWRARQIHSAELARALSLRLGLGVLVYASAITAGLPLRTGLFAGAVGAGLGLVLALRRIRRQPLAWQVSFSSLAWIALALTIVFLASMVLPMDALWANDARSVWFFHGKMIYLAGGLRADSGWSEPAIDFSHPEYPKLIPILAASEMLKFGYWNEYLPKLALVAPLACYVFGLFAGARGRASLSTVATTLVALLSVGSLLHNGYVDAYVALPAAGALLAIVRWLSLGERSDAEHAMVLVGLALSSKEEGRLFAVALAAGLCPFLLVARVRHNVFCFFRSPFGMAVTVVALAPAVLWGLRADSFGVHSYLKMNLATKLRASQRLRGGALRAIMRSLVDPRSRWFDAATSAFSRLLATTVGVKLFALALSKRLRLASLVCLSTGTVYFVALCAVYLMTPFDFQWQLNNSADRVMLVTNMCVLVLLADALEDLEGFNPRGRRGSAPNPG